MQLAATRRNGASVFVDYAHTPDAFHRLRALRPHVMGRLIVPRRWRRPRPTKRPLMGQAARENADVLSPTTTPAAKIAAIRAAILAACPEANEVGDRAEAILRAVDALQPGDALLTPARGTRPTGDHMTSFPSTMWQASIACSPDG